MKWIKINSDDLPDDEVLAKDKNSSLLIGYIRKWHDKIYCESYDSRLDHVTHYIPANKLNQLEIE